jgi:MarR family transcriptional regulator, transcriptional regulator for hemolysin
MKIDSTFGFLLHDVARRLKKRFEQKSRGSGLTRSQWQVLAYLAQNEGINQARLAELILTKEVLVSGDYATASGIWCG